MPDARTGSGLWKRFLLGTLLIVGASASATAVAAFREVDKVVTALETGRTLELGGVLAEADAGKPQTLMLIGSDRRAKTSRDGDIGARSDTVMLVRLDPSKKATALMSLPRDLKVEIPGHGPAKLNAAYEFGGPELTLKTVKRLTGLPINHVINIDFRGFREGVNAIGCVYVDIDRYYFNNVTGPGGYAAIDIKQGYQKLCGQKALDYVRYRHTDSDLVRSARQQEFLRQAKQQVGVGELISDRDKLVKIFSDYTESDLRGRKAVLRLLKLAIASARRPIREVHFEGQLAMEEQLGSIIESSHATVKKLAQQFLGVEETRGPRGEPRTESRAGRRKKPDLGLEDASGAGRDQALQLVNLGLRGMDVFYPRLRTRRALFAGEPRVYGIRAPDGRVHRAYRMVVKRHLTGEYYGLQGTTWKDPPILEDPDDKRRIRGRIYELHYDGDRLRLVAWRTREAVYWISNTLLQSLPPRQMLAIARSARTLGS